MALNVSLPKREHSEGWRLKIRDNERLEPPHVTVLFKGTAIGRWGLRERAFLVPPACSLNDVPQAVRDLLGDDATFKAMCEHWDKTYASNPVGGSDDPD